MLKKGLIQVYTGNGKGKTTAALGLALRAIGTGLKVAIIQFLKAGKDCGEIKALSSLKPFITVESFGREGFIDKKPSDQDYLLAQKAFDAARAKARENKIDILILDELNVALYYKLLDLNKVSYFLQNKPDNLEIVITGRYAPPEIIKIAHLVTEMRELKHPYQVGIMARKGIEY